MKKPTKKYLIYDRTNKIFWKSNIPYGYGTNNKPVFETRFTEKLNDATLMTRADAKKILQKFGDYEFVVGGYCRKVDGSAIEIREVCVTVELQLKPKYMP